MPHTPLHTPFQLFSTKQCKKIIKLAQQQHAIMRGWTMGGVHSMRTNSVYWLHPDDIPPSWDLWVQVKRHLSARPDLPVDWLQEHWQISKYHTGEFYDWHSDSRPEHKRSSERSLTLTCTLQSAPGAALELGEHRWELPAGWAVVFPASDLHRATPPTQGTRWALTVWGMAWNQDVIQSQNIQPTS